MNLRSALLGLFVALTIVLASTTVYESGIRTTVTSTSTMTSTSTSTLTSTLTQTTTVTSTSNSSASASVSEISTPASCTDAQPPSVGDSLLEFGSVVVGTSSPATICLQLFYFAPTPETFNLTTALSIVAQRPGQSFSGNSNFTVSSSQGEVQMGGPAQLGEGTVVAYSIAAKPGASGTYEVDFSPVGAQGRFLLYGNEPVSCPYYGELVAGDGSPSYVLSSGCLTISSSYYCSSTTSSSSSLCTTIPGVSYPLVGGNVYFKVIGVTNSTQS